MTTLSWIFRGVDAISRPARAAVASLRQLRASLTAVRRDGGGRFQASWLSQARRQFAGFRRGLNDAFGGIGRVAAPVAAIGAAGAAAAGMLGASVVRLAAFQQSAETSLAASLGSAETAQQAFREAITIANQTPLDTTQVVDAMQSLAAAGFRTLPALRPMLGILTDVGATHGADAMQRFSLALGQVQARGALTMEELNQLREAAPSIAQPLMAALGGALNITGPNAGRQIQAAISARRVTAAMLNSALGQAGATMNAGTGGGLGGIARAQSQTLVGSLSNVSNAWDNLLMSFGTGRSSLAQGAGLSQFRAFVDSVTNALDASTPRGQRAIAALRPLIDGVFGTLFRGTPGTSIIDTLIESLRQMTPGILAVVRGVRDFADGFGSGFMAAMGPALELLQQLSTEGEEGGTVLRDLGRAVGFLVGAFVIGAGVLGGVVSTVVSGWTQVFTDLPAALRLVWADVTTWFSTVPGALVDGFLGRLRTEWGRLIGQVEGLARQLPASVRSVLGIHSPSRVFAEIGLHTAQGMASGLSRGQADVERAMSLVVTPGAAARAPAAAGVPAGGIQVTFVLDGRRDAQGIVDEAEDRLAELFANLFERAALTAG